MVDTIRLKIKDLEIHKSVVTFLDTLTETTKYNFEHDDEIIQNEHLKKKKYGTGYFYASNFKYYEVNKMLQLPSSTYSININIDKLKDAIFLEFSIPKYLYNSNILQLTPHNYETDYHRVYNCNYENIHSYIYDYFIDKIKYILKSIHTDIQFKNVYLERLDLCFNVFYLSKSDALNCLEDLKKLKFKAQRENSKSYHYYPTSLMYSTQRYSHKIYHKGSEFEKNDSKELRKFGFSQSELNQVQNFSDLILRYESTFRKSAFDYYYQRLQIKQYNKYFLPLFNRYMKYKSLNHEKVKKFIITKKITAEQIKEFREMLKTIHKSNEYPLFSKITEKIYFQLVKKHNEFIKSFTPIASDVIQSKDNMDAFLEKVKYLKINNFNKKNPINLISIDKIKVFIELISKYGSFKELIKQGFIKKSTYYQYKKVFDYFEINPDSVNFKSYVYDLNLSTYYQNVVNYDLLNMMKVKKIF